MSSLSPISNVRDGAKLVEFLHLAFLQALPMRVPVAEYVVKGGANLRLFFDSRRRSQEIDLDFTGSAFWRLAERAAAAAFAIPFDAYRELVVDLLEDEFVAIYDREEVWDEMVVRVAEFLETLRWVRPRTRRSCAWGGSCEPVKPLRR